jgi:hypothetical protein
VSTRPAPREEYGIGSEVLVSDIPYRYVTDAATLG